MTIKKEEAHQRRIDREKAALRDRIADFFIGATSGHPAEPADLGGTLAVAGVEQLVNWMRSMERALPLPEVPLHSGYKSVLDARNAAFWYGHLPQFESLERAAEHLYDYGFRAEE